MSACKGCGKEIVWGVTTEGKKIPLQELKHVYHGVHSEHPTGPGDFQVIRPPIVTYVSHFVMCPDANKF